MGFWAVISDMLGYTELFQHLYNPGREDKTYQQRGNNRHSSSDRNIPEHVKRGKHIMQGV